MEAYGSLWKLLASYGMDTRGSEALTGSGTCRLTGGASAMNGTAPPSPNSRGTSGTRPTEAIPDPTTDRWRLILLHHDSFFEATYVKLLPCHSLVPFA